MALTEAPAALRTMLLAIAPLFVTARVAGHRIHAELLVATCPYRMRTPVAGVRPTASCSTAKCQKGFGPF